jgi:cytidine deaminase
LTCAEEAAVGGAECSAAVIVAVDGLAHAKYSHHVFAGRSVTSEAGEGRRGNVLFLAVNKSMPEAFAPCSGCKKLSVVIYVGCDS